VAKTRADAIRFAYSHIGDHEDPPGSNHCIYSSWYDQAGRYGSDDEPWCLKFASFVVVGQCGVTLPGAQSPHGFASSVACLQAAHDHSRYASPSQLRGGDFVIYHVPGERAGPNHGGVYIRRCTAHTACVISVDGNTGHSTTENQRDGGCVDEKHRPLSWVLGGYVPDYAKPATVTAPAWWHRTLRRGMAGDDVKVMQRRLKVDDDGAFGPMTEHAVRYVQHRHSLTTTGVVDARTARAIG